MNILKLKLLLTKYINEIYNGNVIYINDLIAIMVILDLKKLPAMMYSINSNDLTLDKLVNWLGISKDKYYKYNLKTTYNKSRFILLNSILINYEMSFFFD